MTSAWRQFGAAGGTIYLIDQALLRLSGQTRLQFYELMIQPIPDEPLIAERFTRMLSYRQIVAGDPEVALMPAREDIKAERFEQGALCLGAFKKDELIGYMWFAFERYNEDEVRCVFELNPGREAVFDFDFYLFPKHRMGLGFISLWEGANRFLRERGVRYTYSRLTRFNVASRKAHNHLGWKRLGRAVFLKLWGFEMMCSDVRPFFNISLSRPVRIALHPDALGVGA